MVKHTVQNDFHSPLMYFFHKMGKKLIGGFQILFVHDTFNIFGGMGIVLIPFLQYLSAIFLNNSKMWVDIIIVLCIVFVIRRRNKDGIQVEHLHA